MSQTVAADVLYCTIQTPATGVVASLPIPQGEFESVNASSELSFFARGIEEVMALPNVIAGRGTQLLDANGLLQDVLVFTVEYVPSTPGATSITAEATVPNAAVMGSSTTPGQPGITAAKAEVDKVYAALQALAG